MLFWQSNPLYKQSKFQSSNHLVVIEGWDIDRDAGKGGAREIIHSLKVQRDTQGTPYAYELQSISLSPAFDNGSSFGHNLQESALVNKKLNIDAFNDKGTHHMKLNRDDKKQIPHKDTVKIIHQYLPECLDLLHKCLNFSQTNVQDDLMEVQTLESNLPSGILWLTDRRIDFIMEMIHTRQTYFRSELEKLCSHTL
ncbi:MAG: hypothetical protein EAY65_06880 [Alphaproteobacteria bacterium]|nr:MAG: hypothetical protein EAY65_06880 [Alphaproteobacteria bacterium]